MSNKIFLVSVLIGVLYIGQFWLGHLDELKTATTAVDWGAGLIVMISVAAATLGYYLQYRMARTLREAIDTW